MYHCHILEHHEAGMMAHFDVVDPGLTVTGNHNLHSSKSHFANHEMFH
jgi:hypothetical protein